MSAQLIEKMQGVRAERILLTNLEIARETWKWKGGDEEVVVFMGDYIDRGPQSKRYLNLICDTITPIKAKTYLITSVAFFSQL